MDEPCYAPRSRARANLDGLPYPDNDLDYLDLDGYEGRYTDPRYDDDILDSRPYGRDYHDHDMSSFGRNRGTRSIGDRSEMIRRFVYPLRTLHNLIDPP